MIIDKFSILDWNVTILYETTCDDIDFIIRILKAINCPNYYIKKAFQCISE